jgi:hypothetical protein
MVSPLRNSALNTPEKLLSRADSGDSSSTVLCCTKYHLLLAKYLAHG